MSGVGEAEWVACAEAAEWFDRHWPAEAVGARWWELVDGERLNMVDTCRCVAGQLLPRIAELEGFRLRREEPGGEERVDVPGLPTGFDLLVDEPGDWDGEEYGELRRLLGLVRKRLEFQALPASVATACGGRVPGSLWRGEIRRRQGGEAG